jgi:hypothetical protein
VRHIRIPPRRPNPIHTAECSSASATPAEIRLPHVHEGDVGIGAKRRPDALLQLPWLPHSGCEVLRHMRLSAHAKFNPVNGGRARRNSGSWHIERLGIWMAGSGASTIFETCRSPITLSDARQRCSDQGTHSEPREFLRQHNSKRTPSNYAMSDGTG